LNNATTISNKTIRIVFAGTPDFAVPSLNALAGRVAADFELAAVYTQPDRPAGRGRRLRESDIKKLARTLGVRIEQPTTLRDVSAQHILQELKPDLLVVAAYGLILPQAVLDIPSLGCVNVHASLLPRWRGAAPVQRAILAGDTRTGVTLMQMDAGLDTGAMLAHRETVIGSEESGGELTARLAQLGGELLLESLPQLLNCKLRALKQDDSQATLAPKIKKREARIDWNESAVQIARKVRAFNPWPVAETILQDRQLRLWSARCDGAVRAKPGTVLSGDGSNLKVATGDGALLINSLQLAGKRVMTAGEFLNAHSIEGVVLGGTDDSS